MSTPKGQEGATRERVGEFQGQQEHPAPLTATEDRQWATLAHFGGILGFVPALVIYFVFKDRGPFTAQEAKEALNFTLFPTIVVLVFSAFSLLPVVGGVFAILNGLIWVAMAILCVRAGVVVNSGRPYRYRLNPRWIGTKVS